MSGGLDSGKAAADGGLTGAVHPGFPGVVKVVLAACMLFGRLEIFTLLALFSREFWRR